MISFDERAYCPNSDCEYSTIPRKFGLLSGTEICNVSTVTVVVPFQQTYELLSLLIPPLLSSASHSSAHHLPWPYCYRNRCISKLTLWFSRNHHVRFVQHGNFDLRSHYRIPLGNTFTRPWPLFVPFQTDGARPCWLAR